MFRRVLVVISAVALLALAGPASAQTVDELVAKNVQAKGGMEKLRAVETVKLEAVRRFPRRGLPPRRLAIDGRDEPRPVANDG